jgi:hypothetical protein
MDYILVERDQFDSRLNPGSQAWVLTFYCLSDGTFWEMTVDSSYANYRRSGWRQVVQDPAPWGIYHNLRRTDRRSRTGMPIVTADSRADRTSGFATQDLALTRMSQDYHERHAEPPAFQELFE